MRKNRTNKMLQNVQHYVQYYNKKLLIVIKVCYDQLLMEFCTKAIALWDKIFL